MVIEARKTSHSLIYCNSFFQYRDVHINDNVLSKNTAIAATVTAVQESLQQSQSVEEIQRLSETGDNEAVVDLLLQTFQQSKHKSKVS